MIEVKNFSKQFDADTYAVSDLSFSVASGEIFAFLGANGSGKTTTIRTLLGIYEPDDGALLIQGRPYDTDQAVLTGYLPEERGLYKQSRAQETLEYFARLKGVSKNEATKRARDYLERVGLMDKAYTEIKHLSSGQQQKIQLGTAVINNPELLILDEPTKGLDPVNRQLLMDLLLERNNHGATVVFITHQLEEVERIADKVMIIKDGKRQVYGAVNQVKQSYGDHTVHIRYSGNIPAETELFSATIKRRQAELTPKDGVNSEDILRWLLDQDITVTDFRMGAPSLEEIFIRVYDED